MAKRKMRALRGSREARQRSYWWGKVRITTYITMVILQLLIVFYDSFHACNAVCLRSVDYRGRC